MSQQLPGTDLSIKAACLFLLTETMAPPFALSSGYFSVFCVFLPVFLMQKRLREVTPFSDRKGLWGRRVSGLFFLQTDREKEGELFLCFGDKRRPFFSLSIPVELTPSTSFPSLLPLTLFESVTHTYVDTQDTQYFVVFFPLCVVRTAPPC